ncbi:hypothetical protein TVAG_178240 [Trichomonas vaginalis G3]|uniref:Uncharacterized protein n=1 Tax=Trichomonas vaginalis (strain ATCC PRA-98 / G3) TaxID=412133 RepID=A2DIH6_TRIV3|nr:hypothetical protein TVAGG3_0600640 [Trichomonas vaginalis G3]EAY19780.1 hypothetical protein TVAG_178240 [Trichomonas vaginalis G3]KAI5523905.1 hypothetical protein TVAGG3_0600640 [Trichomonas vaginalis G3]|eukprot:XP_001580766.1 hypothetical protein [Trichomonas vaginalis G3]
MKYLDDLKSELDYFMKEESRDRDKMIEIIRKDLIGMLKNSENFSSLTEKIQLKKTKIQYRTMMWNILLGLGKIDEHDADKYITAYHYLSNSDQRKLLEELQRISKAQKEQKNKTDFQSYCSFLVLFSGFLSHSGATYPLHQPLLTFGQILLQNYSYPLAFFSFKQFVEYYAPHCYPKKGGKNDDKEAPKLAVQIAYEYEPQLVAKFKRHNPEYSFSFNHVNSFFTQMKPVDQVSIIFDFIFAFGAFMVIFIEAGWLYINSDIKDNTEAYNLPDAAAVIKKGIEILKKTKPELIEKAQSFYK